MGKVVPLQDKRRQAALERLNRLTGLAFDRYPESLVRARQGDEKETAPASRQA